MRVLLPAATALLGFLLLVMPAWAGKDAEEVAKRLARLRGDLKSEKAATVAHAAYAASEQELRDLAPDLLRALVARRKPEGREAWRVVQHLFDALIRLDAKVPQKLLQHFEEDLGTPVLILSVRNGEDAHPLLRKTLERSIRLGRIRASGVAAGNVLSAARDKCVAPLVLPHFRPEVDVIVRDHDRLEGRGRGRAYGGHGDFWCTAPEGFPPAVWYELEFERDPDFWARRLVRGPVKDVWYERWVDKRKKFIRGDLSDKGDASEVARGWIAQLLGTEAEKLVLKEWYFFSHRWSSPEAYLAFIEEKRREVKLDADTLEARLVEAGLLTKEQSTSISIAPAFDVWDGRDDRSTPLPEQAGR